MKKIRDYISGFVFVSAILSLGACAGYFARPYIEAFKLFDSSAETSISQGNRITQNFFNKNLKRNKLPLEMEVEDFQILQRNREMIVRARQDGKMYEVVANNQEISGQERQSGIKQKTRISFYRLSEISEDLVGNR